MAFGALHAAARLGVRVPEDLSVIGFDDLTLAAMSTPPLTSVSHQLRNMGQTAVQMLMRRINGERVDPVEIATALVLRESCAPFGGRA
jgi:LacI family transcriptional regulator